MEIKIDTNKIAKIIKDNSDGLECLIDYFADIIPIKKREDFLKKCGVDTSDFRK